MRGLEERHAKASLSMLAAPTIVAHGNEEQKQTLLLRILNGQDAWCPICHLVTDLGLDGKRPHALCMELSAR